jgi:hypothetical protein
LPLSGFKALMREQFFMLVIDEEAALSAIPKMLPADPARRQKGFQALCQVLGARGALTGEAASRLERIAQLFDVDPTFAAEALARAGVEKAAIARAS